MQRITRPIILATWFCLFSQLAKVAWAQTETNLHSFTSATDGNGPQGELVQGSDRNFYGTTTGGGTNQAGAIFKMTPAGDLTILHSFGDQPEWAGYPAAPME